MKTTKAVNDYVDRNLYILALLIGLLTIVMALKGPLHVPVDPQLANMAYAVTCAWSLIYLNSLTLKLKTQRKKVRLHASGYVYLLKADNGLYKIGHTGDYRDRIRTFKVKLPFDVQYEHIIPADDRLQVELTLHKRYAKQRIRGEWFDLSTEDVRYIKSLGTNGVERALVYEAKCDKCAWSAPYPTKRGATNALVAHNRHHHPGRVPSPAVERDMIDAVIDNDATNN